MTDPRPDTHGRQPGAPPAARGNFLTRPFRQTYADLRDPGRSRWQRAGTALAVAFVWLSIIPAALAIFVLLVLPAAPNTDDLRRQTTAKPTIILASDGSEIAQLEGRNRVHVPLDSISSDFIDALLAVEDQRFFEHRGVDWRRTARAGLRTAGGRMEGGSTITQQLARNLYPDEIGRSLSLRRKAKEFITARRIERSHTKEQILEAYVNSVPFLYNAFGVEMAARTYYDTHAIHLDVLQSATLVGMLKGTSYYNPVRNPERAEERRNLVLDIMVRRGVLDPAERDALREQPLGIDFQRQEGPSSKHPHFTRYVRSWLSEWADRHGYDLNADGLVVHTTLDPSLQEFAEAAARQRGQQLHDAAVAEWSDGSGTPLGGFWARNPRATERALRRTDHFREAVANGGSEQAVLDSISANRTLRDSLLASASRLEVGFVAIEPRTGHVKAWVGSRNFNDAPYDHVAQARRQPGSVFKPFIYAAALQRGYLPGDTFIDERPTIEVDRNRVWRPTNAGGHYTGQPMTLTEGLAYSKNTIAAKLAMEVGITNVATVARSMGVRESRLEPVPALALGTSEVSLLEMATAYATLAAGGMYHPPVPVRRVETREGRVLAEFGSGGERAIPQDVAQVLTHMMRGVIERGTGVRIRSEFGIRADVAGKTGTSQHGADGWFLLMHPHLVAGSWVGFPEPTITFRTNQWGQGSRNALLVVGDFFRQAEGVIPEGSFDTPLRYQEPGSIWERARRWWASSEYDDYDLSADSLYRADVHYDDLAEWAPGSNPLAGLDDDLDDDLEINDYDTLDDLDAPDPSSDAPVDPAASGDETDDSDEAAPPADEDGRTAVQRLYERAGEELERDLRDNGDDDES